MGRGEICEEGVRFYIDGIADLCHYLLLLPSSLVAKKIVTIKVRCPFDVILDILLISKPAAWSSKNSSSEISGSTPLITTFQSVCSGLGANGVCVFGATGE